MAFCSFLANSNKVSIFLEITYGESSQFYSQNFMKKENPDKIANGPMDSVGSAHILSAIAYIRELFAAFMTII